MAASWRLSVEGSVPIRCFWLYRQRICLANYGLATLVSDYLCEGRIWFSGYSTVVLSASFVSEAVTSQATSDLTGDGWKAEAEVIYDEKEDYPVILLDDFMSELDKKRIKGFAGRIKNNQVLITCTEKFNIDNMVYNIYKVEHAKVERKGEI